MIDRINARNRELNLQTAKDLQTLEFQEDGMYLGVPFGFGFGFGRCSRTHADRHRSHRQLPVLSFFINKTRTFGVPRRPLGCLLER
jgi:hypothetical protein